MSMRLLHQDIHHPSCAGTIRLLLTENQLESALNLYTTIIKARGLPAPELPDAIHNFCVTLLKPGDLPSDILACPTDQVLFLLGIRPQGMYASARSVKSTCSALQHCLRTILIHIVRQKHHKIDAFRWYEATKPLETNIDVLNAEFTDHPDDPKNENPDEYESEEEYLIQHNKDEEDKGEGCEDADDNVLLEKIMNEVYTCEEVLSLPHDFYVESRGTAWFHVVLCGIFAFPRFACSLLFGRGEP
jgi:hypothetical protein